MKIGLTINGDRISSVFDATDKILLVEISDNRVGTRDVIELIGDTIFSKAEVLRNHQVVLLICGAISACNKQVLEDSGITVIGFICGNSEIIISEFIDNQLQTNSCKMPGCANLGRRKRKRCRHSQNS